MRAEHHALASAALPLPMTRRTSPDASTAKQPRGDDAIKSAKSAPRTSERPQLHTVPAKALLLHFFVNMAVVGDVESELQAVKFGRIHHRILFFAAYAPGLTVSELIESLRVSHENVRLPMKHLHDGGYLRVEIGKTDRRQKLLFVTTEGRRLVESLRRTQLERISNAFSKLSKGQIDAFLQVHELLIDETDRRMLKRMWDG